MKNIDEILNSCSDIEELITERIKYEDSLPCDSLEMPSGDSIGDKILAMKYFDGTIEAFDDPDGRSPWKNIYDEIWRIHSKENWFFEDISLDQKQVGMALKLYFALEPTKKGTCDAHRRLLLEAFEKMFAVLYLKYGKKTEGYEKLKNIAYQAYLDFEVIQDLVDRQMENVPCENDHFLPVRKASENYNSRWGVRLEETRDGRQAREDSQEMAAAGSDKEGKRQLPWIRERFKKAELPFI